MAMTTLHLLHDDAEDILVSHEEDQAEPCTFAEPTATEAHTRVEEYAERAANYTKPSLGNAS